FGDCGSDFLFVETQVRAGRNLVALDLVIARYGLARIAVHKLPAEAVSGLAINQVKRNAFRSRCCRVERDRTQELLDLQLAFPICTRRHRFSRYPQATYACMLVPSVRLSAC